MQTEYQTLAHLDDGPRAVNESLLSLVFMLYRGDGPIHKYSIQAGIQVFRQVAVTVGRK